LKGGLGHFGTTSSGIYTPVRHHTDVWIPLRNCCGANASSGESRRITVAHLMTFTEDDDNIQQAPLELSCSSTVYLIALRHNDHVFARSKLDIFMGISTSLPVQCVSMQGAQIRWVSSWQCWWRAPIDCPAKQGFNILPCGITKSRRAWCWTNKHMLATKQTPVRKQSGSSYAKKEWLASSRPESHEVKGEVSQVRVLSVWKETRPHQKVRPTAPSRHAT
jgi:hypothetical protein